MIPVRGGGPPAAGARAAPLRGTASARSLLPAGGKALAPAAGEALLAAALLLLPSGLAAVQESPGARASASSPASEAVPTVLDIPYVPQSEALCGGAAVAMVLRYWGERGVRAEDFAHLVGDPERGITTTDLVEAARDRGWRALPFAGDAAEARRHLEAGRPLVLLIEYRPDRYHYVVLAGWVGDRAVVHDPADAPFRLLDPAELERRWSVTERWSLLLLPADTAEAEPEDDGAPPTGGEEAPAEREASGQAPPDAAEASDDDRLTATAAGSHACGALVERGVALAREDRLEEATAALETARDCGAPGAARELAGVLLRRDRPVEALGPAREAAARDPSDAHATRTLAAALYLSGRSDEALAAWNGLDAPRVDLVEVGGLLRTRHEVARRAIGLEPGDLLTPARLREARRRLGALPAARAARVDYRPAPGGVADVDAALTERPLLPVGVVPLGALGARAALEREAGLRLGSPTGGGELLTVAGRWWASRPRVEVALAAPAPLSGAVWRVEGSWEHQTYVAVPELAAAGSPEPPPATTVQVLREERSRAILELERWQTGRLAWRAGATLDRWGDRGTYGGATAGLSLRTGDDRLDVSLDGALWTLISADDVLGGAPEAGSGTGSASGSTFGSRFGGASVGLAWRSRVRREGTTLGLRADARLATGSAPLALWPGAGTGHARSLLARAHPLLDGEGALDGALFGRRLLAGTAELTRWVRLSPDLPLRVGVAAFADGALAGGRLEAGTARALDAGLGLRLALPGAGEVRVDAATALLDGAEAVSASVRPPWPGRP